MKGLMELLSKGDSETKAEPSDTDLDLAPGEAEPVDSESFDASASAAMDAINSGDSAAFAEALKACIEMSR